MRTVTGDIQSKGYLSMKFAIQTDKKNKRGKIMMRVLFVISAAALCAGGAYLIRKRNIRIAEEERIRQEEEQVRMKEEKEKRKKEKVLLMEAYFKENEVEFSGLEKLFQENEEDLQNFIDALDERIMEENEYCILFYDSERYRAQLSGNKTSDYLSVLYSGTFHIDENEEMESVFNKNTELREAVNRIIENRVIVWIDISYCGQTYQGEDMRIVEFWIDTKFTPFITTNNDVENSFAWCDHEDCIRYGYKNVEGNWYLNIAPEPE